MAQMLSIGAVLLGLAALMGIAQGAAWALTEAGAPVINMRPFNCRPCLTFWLTWGLLIGAAVFINDVSLRTVLDALIFAFINFYYIKTKIQIYE